MSILSLINAALQKHGWLIAGLPSDEEAFLCGDFGLSTSPRPDHASYLASWLKVLKADNRAIFTAASAAAKAADWLTKPGA